MSSQDPVCFAPKVPLREGEGGTQWMPTPAELMKVIEWHGVAWPGTDDSCPVAEPRGFRVLLVGRVPALCGGT